MQKFMVDQVEVRGLQPSHLEILSGWKDIGNYLRKGVRTVQRYERELALPVRRPSGKQRGSVLATKSDLDSWVLAAKLRAQVEKPRQRANNYEAQWQEFRTAIERMKRLCDETARLRAECALSRQKLCQSIQLIAPHAQESLFQRRAAVSSAKPASSPGSRVERVPVDRKLPKAG